MPDDEDDLGERFLKLNANADYMATHLAQCIRNCMRGVAASDPSSARYNAVQSFEMLLKLMVRSEGVRLHEIFDKALDELRAPQEEIGGEWSASRYYDRSIITAAEDGLRFLVESSCSDPAAKGRASKRESDFLDSIKRIEEARQEMNKESDKRWRQQSASEAKPNSRRKR